MTWKFVEAIDMGRSFIFTGSEAEYDELLQYANTKQQMVMVYHTTDREAANTIQTVVQTVVFAKHLLDSWKSHPLTDLRQIDLSRLRYIPD